MFDASSDDVQSERRMKRSVYLETTIPSYLTAWRSPELVMAARQHIANAMYRPTIESTCRAYGYQMPVICTPEELIGGGG